MMSDTNWYSAGKPFYIEVEFERLEPDTQVKLLKSASEGSEILPGLKVNRLFNQITDKDTIYGKDMLRDLEEALQGIKKFSEKYSMKLNEHTVEKLLEHDIKLTDKQRSVYEDQVRHKPGNRPQANRLESGWIENDGKTSIFPETMMF